MGEIIRIMWAEDLPLETRKEIGIFSGLVEVIITRNSPLVLKEIRPIKGTFSEEFKKILKQDGFLGKPVLQLKP